MPKTATLAKDRLSERLHATTSPEVIDRFVGGTHTQRLADNLLPGFTQEQISSVRAQLKDGAGGELRPSPSGKRPAHAPYSSAALAVNAFGRWLGSESLLRIGALGDFSHPLRVEAKLQISNGGGEANLDVLLEGPGSVVGVESKLTETLEVHPPTPWKSPYHRPAMRNLLHGGWRELFDLSLAGEWQPAHLGIEQLIKHALALKSVYGRAGARHLVYCYWEPANPTDLPEVRRHRDEVARCTELLSAADPEFHAITYAQIFEQWGALMAPLWLSEHVAELRQRYETSL